MQTLKITAVALLALLVCVHARAEEPPKKPAAFENVDVERFEKLMAGPNVVVLDVRTPKEYEAARIKGSVLIDFQAKDFDQKIKELDKSKTYLVHCASGVRSERACKKLAGLEVAKLYNLEGGIRAWQRAGKPVEK
jgi:rhodanese-related sulfurtransferase